MPSTHLLSACCNSMFLPLNSALVPFTSLLVGPLQVGPGHQNRFSLLASRGGEAQGAPWQREQATGWTQTGRGGGGGGGREEGAANGKGPANGKEIGATHAQRNGKGAGKGTGKGKREIEEVEDGDAMDEGEDGVGGAASGEASAVDEEAEEAGWELKARLKSVLKDKADAFQRRERAQRMISGLGSRGGSGGTHEQKFGVQHRGGVRPRLRRRGEYQYCTVASHSIAASLSISVLLSSEAACGCHARDASELIGVLLSVFWTAVLNTMYIMYVWVCRWRSTWRGCAG